MQKPRKTAVLGTNGHIHYQVEIHFEEVVNLFATKHSWTLKLATIQRDAWSGTLGITFVFLMQWGSKFAIQNAFQLQINVWFSFFDFYGFWRENNVIQMTPKFYFHLMNKRVPDFERICWEEFNYKKKLKKLYWFKRYNDLNFEFPAILLLFLELWQISKYNIFWTDKAFSIIFSHLNSSQHILSKSRTNIPFFLFLFFFFFCF